MKSLEWLDLFEGAEARVAILSTYNFDPMFFEARLLRSSALQGARRVVVLMDGREYRRLAREGSGSRHLNRRYLLVPVDVERGVFHAKLSVLLSGEAAHLICGSHNLTQPGCTHNLELANGVSAQVPDGRPPANAALIRQALSFLRDCAKQAHGRTGDIAGRWIDELAAEVRWLGAGGSVAAPAGYPELLCGAGGTLWDEIVSRLAGKQVTRVTALSPFFDPDLALLRRVRDQWPRCQVSLISQQNSGNLPANLLGRVGRRVGLSEVLCRKGRRLHAKLVAFHAKGQVLVVAGSANFTTAAFCGRNREACLAWWQKEDPVEGLFDGDIRCEPIHPKKFVSGSMGAPEEAPDDTQTEAPVVRGAHLNADGRLDVEYAIAARGRPYSLRLAIRLAGQSQPILSQNITESARDRLALQLPDNVLAQIGDAATCTLIATFGKTGVESDPAWVIQESRLTHEPTGGASGSDIDREIAETGHGLVGRLEELGRTMGPADVVAYLRNLSIRYADGVLRAGGQRRFLVRARDPLRPDTVPDWLQRQADDRAALEKTIFEFLDRHEQRVLHRHVTRANINGLGNFLDVLRTMVSLLHYWNRRGVIGPAMVVGPVCRWLDLFYKEVEDEDGIPEPDGYLPALAENLAGDSALLRSRLSEEGVAGHMGAALWVAQTVRAGTERNPRANPSFMLPTQAQRLTRALRHVGLNPPSPQQVIDALARFEALPEEMVTAWAGRINAMAA